MIVPAGDNPRNSRTPLDPREIERRKWESAAVGVSRALAKFNAQCWPSPATMPSVSLVVQAQKAHEFQSETLINHSAQLSAVVAGQQSHGAVVDETGDDPVVIPLAQVPSLTPGAVVPARPRPRRRVTQPGTPWGTVPAADTAGPCSNSIGPSIKERIKANPWGALLLAAGAAAVLYAAMEN